MLSYHADADIHTNPFELGLERLVDLDMDAAFIGKFALQRIRDNGITRRQVGVILDGPPLDGPNTRFWSLARGGETIGKVTSAVYSPRLKANIALAMVDLAASDLGTVLDVTTQDGPRKARVVKKPFFDPRKSIAAGTATTSVSA